jgi:tetratricopeptide (TPR) repeat protein
LISSSLTDVIFCGIIAVLLFVALPGPGLCYSLSNADTFFLRGRYYFEHKDYAKAAIFFELTMQRNPGNADALYYDALTYQRAGDIQRAKALYKHTMAIFPRSKAAYYSFVALKLLQKEALASKSADPPTIAVNTPAAPALPERPPEPADPVGDLTKKAAALHELGRPSEAERYYRDALREAEKYGPNSIKIAEVLQVMGDFYAETGSSGKACELYRRELRIREVYLGNRNHPELATCMLRQAPVYTKDGDLDTSEDLLRRCVDIYQKELDIAERDHKRTTIQRACLVSSKSSLAAILRMEGRKREARSLEQEVKDNMPP